MPAPVIPTLTAAPPAPLRSQEPATFTLTAETFVDWQGDFPTEMNLVIAGIGDMATYMEGLTGSSGPITATALTMGTGTILGRVTASTGAIEELTAAQVRTLIGVGTDVQAYDADLAAIAGLTPSQGDILYHNGTQWTRLAAGTSGYVLTTAGAGADPAWGGLPYILPFFFTSTPTSSEVLMIHVAGADFTIPANFASALESEVGTNPTATFDLDVQQNGVSIGTISVSTGGVVTATTTSGAAKAIVKGDVLKTIAPGSADSTAADMAFTILGVR